MTEKAKCKNCTKEEMIEEMAKDIPFLTLDREVFVSATEKRKVSWTLSKEDNKAIAEELIKQSYCKIKKGSVVLTNAEWARLRNLEINYDDAYEHYLEYEIENQQLKKQVKELEEQRDRQAYTAEELIQEKHRWTAQARKEAVKEFFTELFKQYSVFNDNDVIIAWQVKEALKELAKKHGVEVEE